MKIIDGMKMAIRWDGLLMHCPAGEWMFEPRDPKDNAGRKVSDPKWYAERPEPEVETDPPLPPYCAWDTCQIAQDEAARLKEDDPELSDDAAFQQACEDPDLTQFAWDDLCEDLTNGMTEVNPGLNWKASVRNFGWRHLDGEYKGGETFHCETGADLLSRILPNTDCTFQVYIDYGGVIRITNAHHDQPILGVEWYTIVPQLDQEEEEEA